MIPQQPKYLTVDTTKAIDGYANFGFHGLYDVLMNVLLRFVG
jgi:hypothetical protein